MGLLIQCNECGEPIDETAGYYTATVTLVSSTDADPMAQPPPVRLDWHLEHLPGDVSEPSAPPMTRPPRGQAE